MPFALALGAALAAVVPSDNGIVSGSVQVLRANGSAGHRRLRGDWEHPDAVLLAFTWSWPVSMRAMIDAIAPHAPVVLLREDGTPVSDVHRWLAARPLAVRRRVTVLDRTVDSPWVRDYGPIAVRDRDGSRWLDASYVERPLDDLVPLDLAPQWGARVDTVTWSLDGGALASNGDGLCASTHAYLQAHAIDVQTPRQRQRLLRTIGCRTLVLLPAIVDEPTHHVDLFVQFLATDVVAVAEMDPALSEVDAASMDRSAEALVAAAHELGIALTVVRIPTPLSVDGQLHSHVNGLRLGDVFVMPTFERRRGPAAREAIRRFEAAAEDLRVVTVPAAELLELGGAIHCVALGLWRAQPGATGL